MPVLCLHCSCKRSFIQQHTKGYPSGTTQLQPTKSRRFAQDDNSEEEEDEPPAGIVSFVPHSANKYPKAKKPRTSSDKDSKTSKPERDKAKQPTAARTLVKAGELVHVATDVPLSAQHDMFGAVDTSSFQVCACCPGPTVPNHVLLVVRV